MITQRHESLLTKYCKRCDTAKELTEFYGNRTTKDGFQYYCIQCFKHVRKHWVNTGSKRQKFRTTCKITEKTKQLLKESMERLHKESFPWS